ncbi:MAG: bifunctional UDP-N-acetylmuramoyl-tripeptide:D-alanyl-D-alanine ligase/alanine racemase [Saprospiraceae bacterium]|nr:MAG: bifunctional UDP-N-acetylmuramoyl-tripeptide:D-alanyl-D-alanine ligase/alanine racemase [Saprospiraceae bacterium]
MHYPIRQLAGIMEGGFLNEPPQDAIIEHLLLDSRQVIFPASSVFIALRGRRYDGHEFLEDLYKSGVRNFVISQVPAPHSQFPGANFILVKNTHEAFHRFAAFHRHQFGLPVIGITGSNGKTIVKEWLFQLLHEDYHIVRSPKSYNSQTGVPLSVLQIAPEHTLGIFEVGISQPGEMQKLAPILDPGIGIFTNIGEAHSEGFPNLETKIREKLLLFENVKTLIYCRDNERVEEAVSSWQVAVAGRKVFAWSATGKEADLLIKEIKPAGSETIIEAWHANCQQPTANCQLRIPFTGAASIENAIHCWALMLHLGYGHDTIVRRMAKLEPVAMRLELKEGNNGCTVINDSYNSDFTSLNLALDFLKQQSNKKRHTLILSDILQSGQQPEQLYQRVAGLLLEKKMHRVIGIGTEVKILEKLLPSTLEKSFYPDTSAFLTALPHLTFSEETILLKGARRFGFERIANRLAIKTHNTTLEVNLGALLHNLRQYQSRLQPGTRLMVMVKAGAYGSGSVEVAKLLEFQNVDYLGVAYADEGVELRQAGIQLPIIVMNPEEATFDALMRYRLEPEIYSLGLLEKFLRFVSQHQESAIPAIHLKLDTGMHRLGFEEKDLDAVLNLLPAAARRPPSAVKSIFSHLAASEAPLHDDFTRQQVALFQKMYEKLAAGLGYRPMRHVLNSGGIVRFPEYQMDVVRLGLGLYGIDSSGILQSQLQTVNTLKATISQIKNISPGETVGYARMGRAEKPMRIATISLGYADGLLREAGNGRFSVGICGERAPLIGNVCMDMAMADITHIPAAREGDSVLIFGKGSIGGTLPVEELAACLGTIPYEVFTSISNRVKRVYVQE